MKYSSAPELCYTELSVGVMQLPQPGVGVIRKKMLSALRLRGTFVWSNNMDELMKCATAFDKLLNVQYRIVVAKKGTMRKIILSFNSCDFHHLAGLGKLKDLSVSRENRDNVYNRIIQGNITGHIVKQSRYYICIDNRFEPLSALESLIDSNEIVFRYNSKKNVHSMIDADYLLSSKHNNNDVYIFLKEKQDSLYFCRSFFPKDTKDYTAGQSRYTLLYKEKVFVSDNRSEIQINRLTDTELNLFFC